MAEKFLYIISFLIGFADCVSIEIKGNATVVDILVGKADQTRFQNIEPITNDEILQQDSAFWLGIGENTLKQKLQTDDRNSYKKAKNIVIFIGDGMGISTVTAARIYKGQQKFGQSGEEYELEFDKFPHTALVKTYCVDMQVADSAATATALFTGIKTRYEALSVDVNCNQTIFDKDVYEKGKVDSIMDWAQAADKDTGIITTTRITHATPAATYAHANNRYWECDDELPQTARGYAKDIARQLIEDVPGNKFKVILGGGQQQMGHTTNYTEYCTRQDGRNLTDIWAQNKMGSNFVLASTTADLDAVNDDTEYLLGIFAPDHMPYELDRDVTPAGTPSLTEMTRKALQILKKVEGGLIDQAHHKNYARLSLEEAAEFDNAISLVLNETGPDTLVLVTADHSHAFTFNGYSKRGNDILGYTEKAGEDDRPLLTLAYANGPGFDYHYMPDSSPNNTYPWRDTRTDVNRLNDSHYQQVGTFYSVDETHGGEDVALFVKGPQSDLVHGVVEQNYVAHFISYAGCIGPHANLNPACEEEETTSGGVVLPVFNALIIVPETERNKPEPLCIAQTPHSRLQQVHDPSLDL
ncbi:hypothetical protein NQ317_002208 [Molorchus minor]|uniref:Alkaline phosphatase n=1 Tax=Molorchus minor TaxID=1323400 RepID=A0ABQ9IZL2_9CUCU|nr:hypothetical protein NQ317_002208 [Molorchus minor]